MRYLRKRNALANLDTIEKRHENKVAWGYMRALAIWSAIVFVTYVVLRATTGPSVLTHALVGAAVTTAIFSLWVGRKL